MPKIVYIEKRFRASTYQIIDQANAILAEYEAQGFDLTLRQLYYQFVARGLIPNRDSEYDKLGSIVNDARLAGLIDWDQIVDRTRNVRTLAHWSNPSDILEAVALQYRIDLWANQNYRPEVWIEKDALVGIIAGVCEEFDVPYFAARGYNSQSEQWSAGHKRFRPYLKEGQTPIVFHLGDHDPSGIDMTRDNLDRLALFSGGVEVRRLALNIDQVRQYNPPPNPAKSTDSRFLAYVELYGNESWELDALEPGVIVRLIRDAIMGIRDDGEWKLGTARITEERALLKKVAARWLDVQEFLSNGVS